MIMQERLVLGILCLILTVACGRICCTYYIVEPGRKIARISAGLESGRVYYQTHPAAVTPVPDDHRKLPVGSPGAQIEIWTQQYVLQGDEAAKRQLLNYHRQRQRAEHKVASIISFSFACLGLLVAVGLGLITFREHRELQKH